MLKYLISCKMCVLLLCGHLVIHDHLIRSMFLLCVKSVCFKGIERVCAIWTILTVCTELHID